MNKSIHYHHWVEWSDEPKVYARLVKVIQEEIHDLVKSQRPMPPATVRPMREVAAVV